METVNSKCWGVKQKHVIHPALTEKKKKKVLTREIKGIFQRLTNKSW